MLLSQSGAEATILTSLTRSWKMIANQTDRYIAIRKKEAAQKGKGRLERQGRLERPGLPGGIRSLRQPASLIDHGSAGTSTSTAPGKHR
jgi:hypothetical protein